MTLNAPDWLANVSPHHAVEVLEWHYKTILCLPLREDSPTLLIVLYIVYRLDMQRIRPPAALQLPPPSGLLTSSGHKSSLHQTNTTPPWP